MIKRTLFGITFLLAAYAAIMSTPGVGAQVRQLFWPPGSLQSPGLAVQGTRDGFFVKGANAIGVGFLGTEVASFSSSGNEIVAGEGPWRITQGTLTSAQVLALHTTPVEVISAPGAGKAIVVESAQLMLDFNSIAYTIVGAGDLTLEYTTGVNDLMDACDLTANCLEIAAVVDRFAMAFGGQHATNIAGYQLSPNDGVSFSITGATGVAAGDSPVHYKVRYRIADTDVTPQ